jgi:hypothetical protein
LEVLQAGFEFTPHHGATNIAVAAEVLALVEYDATLPVSGALLILVIAAIPVAVVAVAVVSIPVFSGFVIAVLS